MYATSMDKPFNQPHKVKFPCILFKGDHLLRHCLGIPKVLEVWHIGSYRPSSLASGDHAGDKPSTSDSKIHGKKGKVKFPYKLCEGNHPIHLCTYMNEASKVLDNLKTSQSCLPTSYRKLSHDPSLADQVIDQNSSLVNPTLSECKSCEPIPDQQLVDKMVDSIPPSVHCIFPVESELHTAQVLLISSYSNELGANPPIPMVQGRDPPVLIMQGGEFSHSHGTPSK